MSDLREQASALLTAASVHRPYGKEMSVKIMLDTLQPLFDQMARERDDLRAKLTQLEEERTWLVNTFAPRYK